MSKLNRAVSVLLLMALLLSFSLAGTAEMHKYSYMFFGTFDTAITLIGFAASQQEFDEVALEVETRFTQLHKQFNQYYPYEGLNNLYYLNRHAGEGPVKVPDELFGLIAWAKEEQQRTHGRVNIALGAVLALWHEAREDASANPDQAKLPDMSKLEEARQHTDIMDVVLDEENKTVFFRDPKLRLDVGAVAKGYAAELVAQYLLQSGMDSFIINAGGNVRTGHAPLDGRSAWGIGIQDPDATLVLPGGDDVMDVLYLADESFVTSGDYQRYFTVEGQRYHHLISPDTLMPANFMRSVTIITQDSGYADLLSTAVFLMPYEEGRAYVDSLEGVEAFWILNDRSVHMTKGAEKVAHSMGATAR
ncbi:MAG: FAD:protein FMN transferase [Clostridiales bacterium]|nr:FAD:protein FMN transferase [Clostridiales bacterium]